MKTIVGVVRILLSIDGVLGRFEGGLPIIFSTMVAGNTSEKVSSRYGKDPVTARGNRQEFLRKAGIEQARIVAISPIVRKTGEEIPIQVVEVLRECGNNDAIECDGLMTDDPNTCLELRAADCHPICLIAPTDSGSCFVLLHGGKAELDGQVVKRGVETMCKRFSVLASSIQVFVGPGIGPCCYRDHRRGNMPIDLRAMIEEQAADVGIVHPLYFADYCTCCSRGPDKRWIFPSHRRSDEIGQDEEPESRFMTVIGKPIK